MFATLTSWPTPTATPFSVRLPASGRLAMTTPNSVLPSMSVKPKFAALSASVESSCTESGAFVPAGASLTAVIVSEEFWMRLALTGSSTNHRRDRVALTCVGWSLVLLKATVRRVA